MNPRVLIADDESLLRERLERLIVKVWPEANLVATTENGETTRTALKQHAPDVAFLDIRMPPPDGLALAEEFASASLHVVFVTAFDEYAVEAFEKNACDYLLKPVSEDRLQETVERLKQRLNSAATAHDLSSIRSEIEKLKQPRQLSRIPVHHLNETRFIDVTDIRYFKAEAKYTVAFDETNEFVLSTSLKELESQLDAEIFWRIHRSYLVNANHIESVFRGDGDTMYVRITNREEKLRVSRAHRHLFREL